MWNIYIKSKFDTPLVRYTIKTLIYHIGVVPNEKQIDVYIGLPEKVLDDSISLIFDEGLSGEQNMSILKYEYSILEDIGNGLSLKYENGLSQDKNGRVRYDSLDPALQDLYSRQFVDIFTNKVRSELLENLNARSITYDSSTPWTAKTIILSHDVDDLFGKSWIRYAFWVSKGIRNIGYQIRRIRWWLRQSEDPYFSPLEMCKMEDEFGFKSTFYFMAKSSYLSIDEGRRYNVKSKKVQHLMSEIERMGWEVGYHPSRKTFNNLYELRSEFERIPLSDAKVNGVRRHYLKGTFPKVWNDLEKINIKYDTSVGWPDRFGARAGTCRPFRAFDFINDIELDIYEMPLTFMDGTLIYDSEKKYLEQYYIIEDKLLLSGVMTFLWHTDRLCNEEGSPTWKSIYQTILKHWNEKKIRVISTREFIKEYIEHEKKFSIVFKYERN